MNRFLRAHVLVASLGIAAPSVAAPTYSVTDLGTLGGRETSYGFGLNDLGQSVGYSFTSTPARGFVNNGAMTDVGDIGGGDSRAWGVNNNGQVVGESLMSPGLWRGFVWSAGLMTPLPTFAWGNYSAAYDINDSGQAVGRAGTYNNTAHAAIFQGGGIQDLGVLAVGGNSIANAVNTIGQIAGTASTETTAHAFLYHNGSMVDIGSLGGYSSGEDLNDHGVVVGFSYLNIENSGYERAFLWDGAMHDLGTFGGHSRAYGINDHGAVVGYSYMLGLPPNRLDSDLVRAFLWTDADGMLDLNALIPADSGWQLGSAYAINAAGQIVGSGLSPSGRYHGYLLTPIQELNNVPTPATALLIAAGLASLVLSRRTSSLTLPRSSQSRCA